MFYQWPKILRNLIFWNFLHCNRAIWFLLHIHFMYINTQGVCGKNHGPKEFFRHSLWVFECFFFSCDKVLDFSPKLGRNPKTCSNLTYYASISTLVMYLSMKKIKLSIWMCHQVTTCFKWGGPLDTKKDDPFWYPNCALTLLTLLTYLL
jgi:hypothetical protein